MASKKASAGVWSATDALEGFERLLAAAELMPQHIERNGRRFVLTVLPRGRPARETLTRGGPLEEGDEI